MPASPRSSHSSMPRAGLDPIRSSIDVLQVFDLQMRRPLGFETLVMFIDHAGCGKSLVSVSGTTEPDSILEVVDTMGMCVPDTAGVTGMVVASVRPGGRILDSDDERWIEANESLDTLGLTLYDWIIIGRSGAISMCSELGLESRWPIP